MSTGSWLNGDNLMLQYGTQKTNPEQWGDYTYMGGVRYMEGKIDLTSLTTTPTVQSLNVFFPAGYNVLIEGVEIYADIAGATSTSATLNVGLGYFSGSTYGNVTTKTESSTSSSVTTTSYTANLPGITSISSTAFVAAAPNSLLSTAGMVNAINQTTNSTYVGAYVGAAAQDTSTNPGYITASTGTGTFTSGLVTVRIYYRGYGTIFN